MPRAADGRRDEARCQRQQILLIVAPLAEIEVVDLDDGDDALIVDDGRGEVGHAILQRTVREHALRPEQVCEVVVVIDAQRMRALRRRRTHADFLAQVMAVAAHDVDGNVLHVEDICRHGRRLRVEVFLLDAVEPPHDAVDAADAVIRVHDLAVHAVFDAHALLEQVLEERLPLRRALFLPRVRRALVVGAVGEIAGQHADEEIRDKMQELDRVVQQADELRAMRRESYDEDGERCRDGDDSLPLSIEQAERADVDEIEIDRERAVHGRPALHIGDEAHEDGAGEVLDIRHGTAPEALRAAFARGCSCRRMRGLALVHDGLHGGTHAFADVAARLPAEHRRGAGAVKERMAVRK